MIVNSRNSPPHHHHHEDDADRFRRQMKNEKRHWELFTKFSFYALCILVILTFLFLILTNE